MNKHRKNLANWELIQRSGKFRSWSSYARYNNKLIVLAIIVTEFKC